jgi:DNA polymerase
MSDPIKSAEEFLRARRSAGLKRLHFDPAAPRPAVAAPPEPLPRATSKATAPSKKNALAPLDPSWKTASTLADLNGLICGCLACPLGATRTKFVFGVGNPDAKAVVIGEAPGADEDRQGEPFVGRAGQLLNKILEAINFQRDEVFICNIIKCRPPGNRDPVPEEVAECEPYLHKQLEILQPKIILALGRIAANTLLKTDLPLKTLRASQHTYRGIPMVVTYHPAALLRNPEWKKDTWEDVKRFRALYDTLVG